MPTSKKRWGVELGGIDMNLVPALDALLVERNVTRAARRLGMSQAAMSHALARLRALLDDPLLVRGRGGMLLTPAAERLAGPIRDAVRRIAVALRDPARFNPRNDARAFRIGSVDGAQIVLGPALVDIVRSRAPRVDLAFVPLPADPRGALEARDVDVVLATGLDGPSLHRRRLFAQGHVCLARRGHPAIEELTMASYLEHAHVLVTTRRPPGVVDEILARQGLVRRVMLTVSSMIAAPALVAQSDMLLTLPERVARACAAIMPLSIGKLPFDIPDVTIDAYWHERDDGDAGNAWLRGAVLEAAGHSSRR